MRITNSMMVNQFLSDSNEALNRVSKYQSQVDSTKRISSISDDPQATALTLRARHKLSNIALYKSNIQAAKSYLTEVESSVSSLNEVMKSVYDDVMSASSGAKSPEDYRVLAENIKNLQEEVLSIANTSIGTSYLFGGYNYTGKINGTTKTPPFSVSGSGDLIYNGINLSKISWKADFDNSIKQMTDQMTAQPDGSDLMSLIGAYSTGYAGYSDTFAKDQTAKMLDSIKSILSGAKGAMNEAEEYGINTGSPEYTAFKSFYDKLSVIKNELETEMAKDVPGTYIKDTDVPAAHKLSDGTIDYDYYKSQGISVYTQEELDNLKFNKQNIYNILNVDSTSDPLSTRPNSVNRLLSGSGTASIMTSAINTLSGVVTTPLDGIDYNTSIKQITDQMQTKTDGSDLISQIDSYALNVGGYTNAQAKNAAQSILSKLKSMVSSGNTAMKVAEAYGVDPASAEYGVFKAYNDTLTTLTGQMETALDSASFDKNAIGDILNVNTPNVKNLLTGGTLTTAVNTLSGVVTVPLNIVNLSTEAKKTTQFQIGTTQSVDVTVTGLELMGTGENNFYHLLERASKILSGDAVDPDALSKMVTSLQDAQNNILTLQTKIGSTQNRMTLMSNRYEISEINYTEMKSNAEDADLAEAIINLTTAQSVYNAALAGGAEIIKTSLMDFLR